MMMKRYTARIFGIWHSIFYTHKAALQEGCEKAIVSLKSEIEIHESSERCTGKIPVVVLVARRCVLEKLNRAAGTKLIKGLGIGFVEPPLLPGLG